MNIYFIYVLSDPRDRKPRYVGYTIDPRNRLRDHLYRNSKHNPHKRHWIKKLAREGVKPLMEIVESGCGPWQDAEQAWILGFRQAGCNLLNATSGGEGSIGWHHSEETKIRLRELSLGNRNMVGKKLTPEWKENLRRSHLGKLSDEQRKKLSLKFKGKPISEEHRRKIKLASQGRKWEPERRRKIIAALKGRKFSEEMKHKLSLAHMGYQYTPEHRENMRKAQLARYAKETPEQKEIRCRQIKQGFHKEIS